MAAILSESYGHSSPVKYVPIGDLVKRVAQDKERSSAKESIKRFLKDAFLPQGYPDSVSEDYLVYQAWDTMQAFCSYIVGTLATQAVLKGVGVGDSSASAVAATITWLLKDGLGMIGRILFAWLKGTDLDCNAKRWRLVADVLNDTAMFLDLLAPVFPGFFMLIVCLSSVTRSIVGVAGGATRAALVQHQARRDNMADVSAKDGSQETLVNLAGLLIGLILTPLIADRTGLVWFLFVVFTILHLYANYQAVSVVSMETFNRSRLHLFMKEYLSSGGNMSVPRVINSQEPVIGGCSRFFKLELGASLSKVLLSGSADYNAILKQAESQEYVIYLSPHDTTVYVAFSAASNCLDQLLAVVTVEVFEYLCTSDKDLSVNRLLSSYSYKVNWLTSSSGRNYQELLSLAGEITNQLFTNDFISNVQTCGWVTTHHLLGLQEWRYLINHER